MVHLAQRHVPVDADDILRDRMAQQSLELGVGHIGDLTGDVVEQVETLVGVGSVGPP